MGSIADKLQYLARAVGDIQDAINEKGISCEDSIALGYYGDKIRQIKTGYESGITDFYELEGIYGISGNDFVAKEYVPYLVDYDTIDVYVLENVVPDLTSYVKVCDIEDVTENYSY